ncbi:hypothetical protein [Bradyrhizobium phage BDU-MI-1]|nr:hypothetical protein [Bradyrhizobium phage BDU-MI-1]
MTDDSRVTVLEPAAFDAFLDALENPKPPSQALIDLMRRRPPWPALPHADLLAATVSCSGKEITIQCDGHDVKDRLFNWLTGGAAE